MPIMGMLDGKVAILTGSGRGIGSAAAQMFAAEGALVVVSDLDPNPAEETASAIHDAGGKSIVVAGDVTDPAFPAQLIKATLDAYCSVKLQLTERRKGGILDIKEKSCKRQGDLHEKE